MTPRERILASLARRRPDRVPLTVWARPEVGRALGERFGCPPGEVWGRLGVEGWGGVGIGFTFPDWPPAETTRLEGDFPYAGQDVVLVGPDTFQDRWGVIRRIGADRRYVEWVSGPLQDAVEPREAWFPGEDRLADPGDLPQRVAEQKARDLFVTGGLGMPFKMVWELRGLSQTLMDYAGNRPFLEAMYDQVYGISTEIARRYAAAGVDMIGLTGDISMQDRLLMSPRSWREVDKPRLKYLCDEARRIKPDLHFFIHSDGNYEAIIPDLIELGFDVLNPIQPECMNPYALKRRYGDRVTLHGTGSIQRTLPFGSVADCRREVTDRLTWCGWNGGLVLMPSNVIQADTPLDNVIAWFETAREFDLSRLPDEPPDYDHAPPPLYV